MGHYNCSSQQDNKLKNIKKTKYSSGVQIIDLKSEYRNKTTRFIAYLPDDLKNGDRFPVLYLLHGAFDDFQSWDKNGRQKILKLVNQNRMIIITPDGESLGWYLNSPLARSNQIDSYIIKELIPYVNNQLYPEIVTGKQGIMGLSMGGHGALTLAIKHSGVFQSASSMSGILDITNHPLQWDIKLLLGDYLNNKKLWDGYSACQLLSMTPQSIYHLPILFTTGAKDQFAIQDNRKFFQLIKKFYPEKIYQSISNNGNTEINLSTIKTPYYIYLEYPNADHTWEFWLSQLPHHVFWHRHFLSD